METFNRSFQKSACAEYYRKYRPRWSKEVIKSIIAGSVGNNTKGQPLQLAVDIGCGTGQSTRPLAPFFDKVLGFDISEAQLENAMKDPKPVNVEFRYGSAENVPMPDECADLLTGVTVLHWIHSERMAKEINRLLKPGGWFVFYGFHASKVGFELSDITAAKKLRDEYKLLLDTLYEGMLSNLHSAVEQEFYDPIANYEEIESIPEFLDHRHNTNVCGLIGLLKSYCGYWVYINRFPHLPDPVDEFQTRVMDILNKDSPPDRIPLTLVFHLFLRQGRKPVIKEG